MLMDETQALAEFYVSLDLKTDANIKIWITWYESHVNLGNVSHKITKRSYKIIAFNHSCCPRFLFYSYRGEWPSGLRRCSKNRKVPGSNPTRRSDGPRDPTSLRGSRWPPGRKWKTQCLTSGEWGCPLDNGPKLAVGQPSSS